VVVLGGAGSIVGTFMASMLIGVTMIAGAYYVPWAGAFVIYVVMIAVLTFRPMGLRSARGSH